ERRNASRLPEERRGRQRPQPGQEAESRGELPQQQRRGDATCDERTPRRVYRGKGFTDETRGVAERVGAHKPRFFRMDGPGGVRPPTPYATRPRTVDGRA